MAAKKAEQSALVEAAHVKFGSMSASALENPPAIGDEQVFTVTARCTGSAVELRKDGEIRHVRTMEVIDVAFGKITKAPKDMQLKLVGDDDDLGDDEQDDEGDDDTDGAE